MYRGCWNWSCFDYMPAHDSNAIEGTTLCHLESCAPSSSHQDMESSAVDSYNILFLIVNYRFSMQLNVCRNMGLLRTYVRTRVQKGQSITGSTRTKRNWYLTIQISLALLVVTWYIGRHTRAVLCRGAFFDTCRTSWDFYKQQQEAQHHGNRFAYLFGMWNSPANGRAGLDVKSADWAIRAASTGDQIPRYM